MDFFSFALTYVAFLKTLTAETAESAHDLTFAQTLVTLLFGPISSPLELLF